MVNLKDDRYYVEKILSDIKFLIKHTKDLNKEQFDSNEILLDSIMFRFIQISEHIKKLSTEFIAHHCEIPWRNIHGLRNRIVHEYGNVQLSIVYVAVKKDIYDLLSLFEAAFK